MLYTKKQVEKEVRDRLEAEYERRSIYEQMEQIRARLYETEDRVRQLERAINPVCEKDD